MARYSSERKEAILKKMLPPLNMTISQISQQDGIPAQTLCNWHYAAKKLGMPMPDKKSINDNWSSEQMLAVIIETALLSESELSQYCREKSLYPEQIKRWKQDCLQGFQSSEDTGKGIQRRTKADQTEIKKLKMTYVEKRKFWQKLPRCWY